MFRQHISDEEVKDTALVEAEVALREKREWALEMVGDLQAGTALMAPYTSSGTDTMGLLATFLMLTIIN